MTSNRRSLIWTSLSALTFLGTVLLLWQHNAPKLDVVEGRRAEDVLESTNTRQAENPETQEHRRVPLVRIHCVENGRNVPLTECHIAARSPTGETLIIQPDGAGVIILPEGQWEFTSTQVPPSFRPLTVLVTRDLGTVSFLCQGQVKVQCLGGDLWQRPDVYLVPAADTGNEFITQLTSIRSSDIPSFLANASKKDWIQTRSETTVVLTSIDYYVVAIHPALIRVDPAHPAWAGKGRRESDKIIYEGPSRLDVVCPVTRRIRIRPGRSVTVQVRMLAKRELRILFDQDNAFTTGDITVYRLSREGVGKSIHLWRQISRWEGEPAPDGVLVFPECWEGEYKVAGSFVRKDRITVFFRRFTIRSDAVVLLQSDGIGTHTLLLQRRRMDATRMRIKWRLMSKGIVVEGTASVGSETVLDGIPIMRGRLYIYEYGGSERVSSAIQFNLEDSRTVVY